MRVLQAIRGRGHGWVVGSALAVSLVLGVPVVAGAAGTGYGGGGGGPGGGGVGVPGSVVRACDGVGRANTCSARIGRYSVQVSAPSDDLPPSRQLVITSTGGRPPERGLRQLFAMGIGLFDQGAKLRGALPSPLVVTVHGAGLSGASTVYEVSSTGSVRVTSVAGTGTLTFSVPSDPVYSIDDPAP